GTVVGYNPYLQLYQITLPAGTDVTLAESSLSAQGGVGAAIPHFVFSQAGDFIPNDPPYLTGADPGQSWAFRTIQAPAGWMVGNKAPQPVVALVDTGVDGANLDLQGKIASGVSFLGGNSSPEQDVNGHGTHLAGLIAANMNNNVGIAGVCPRCKVMPVKACNDNGDCPFFAVINGVVEAANRHVDVINLSIEGAAAPGSDAWRIFQSAVDYARQSGAVVVAAAGNKSNDTAWRVPAGLDGVFTVGATDKNDAAAFFTNYGTAVKLGAPGVELYSLSPGGAASFMDGTSGAAALVSGAAGLLKSINPSLSATEIFSALINNADPMTGTRTLGAGRLNIKNLVSPYSAGNTPPVLTNFGVQRPVMSRSQSTIVTAQASDPDGDQISYAFEATGGSLSAQNGNRITWTAPDVRGEYQIRVKASDGRGGNASGIASVSVDLEGMIRLFVAPGPGVMRPGEVVKFKTHGEYAEAVSHPVNVVWEAEGTHGVITQDGTLTAVSPGEIRLTARAGDKIRKFVMTVLDQGVEPTQLEIAGYGKPPPGTNVVLGSNADGQHLVIGDVNGGSINDVIIGEYGPQSRVYLGLGTGNFNMTYILTDAAGACQTRDMDLADFDNDGDLDLGVACDTGQGYVIYKNNGAGTFTMSQRLCNGDCNGTSIKFVDIDHDAKLEVLASTGNSDHYNYIYDNLGTGSFDPTPKSVGSRTQTYYIVPGFFNGDDYLDFAEVNYDPLRIYVYNPTTKAYDLSYESTINNLSYFGAASELTNSVNDCDGALDIAVVDWSDNGFKIYRGDGNGSIDNVTSYDVGGGKFYFSLAVGQTQTTRTMPDILLGNDVDILDLYTKTTPANYCGSSYSKDATFPNTINTPYEARFGDLDGDHTLDFIDAGPLNQNDVWINNTADNAVPGKPQSASCTTYVDTGLPAKTHLKLQWMQGTDTDPSDPDLLTYDIRLGTSQLGREIWSDLYPSGPGNFGRPKPVATGPGANDRTYEVDYVLGPGNDLPLGDYYFNVRTVDISYNRSAWATTTAYACSNTCPTVSNTNDSGAGSLRECITEANTTAGAETIKFSSSLNGQSIKPLTELPEIISGVGGIGDGTIIDGETNNVALDGSLCANCNGLVISADDVQIKNITVVNFDDATCNQGGGVSGCAGIAVHGSNGTTTTLEQNYIGINPSDVIAGNYFGIYAGAGSGATLDSVQIGTAGKGNVISGNKSFGVAIGNYANHVYVQGNKIGTNVAGDGCLDSSSPNAANLGGGVEIMATGSNNGIGVQTTDTTERNVIACNGVKNTASANTPGVYITGLGSDSNLVYGNYIGVCTNGASGCGNWGPGVRFNSAGTLNKIGGANTQQQNVISANKLDGVAIETTSNVTVTNGRIGLPASGDYTDLGNLGYGVSISGISTSNTIVTTAGATATIAYNGKAAISIDGVGATRNSIVKAVMYENKDNLT
ncbi:MAG TPA: S8 family serine peptidase, partial [bacterium]|nr:S8 family serine peptidase [bacterium]